MNIVHVLSGLTKGGGERMVLELANQSRANGNTVTILAGWPENPEHLQNKLLPGIEVKFISKQRKFAYLHIFSFLIANRKWLTKQDIVHCHLMFGYVFGASCFVLLKKIFRYKLPLIIETNHAVGMPVPKFNRWVHSCMASMGDGLALMAEDPYWNAFIKKNNQLLTATIKNGVSVIRPFDISQYKTKLSAKLNLPKAALLVGTISMLRPDRKPLLYIPIFKEIYQALGNQVHFILGGSGEEYNNIQNLIAKEGLQNNFHMLGLVNEPTEIISCLDVYVSISVGETAGISMIEAAMCGVPLVAIQAIPTYEVKASDWVWSDPSTGKVAQKIISLLKNAEEQATLAEKQFNYVNMHFTSSAMYNAYFQFYKELLSSQVK